MNSSGLAWLCCALGVTFAFPSRGVENRSAASLFGELTLDDGQVVTGALRWDEEESLWLHHFNGRKAEPTDLDVLPDSIAEAIHKQLPGRQLRINDSVIELNSWFGRHRFKPQMFAVEFGAISELTLGDEGHVDITFIDGSTLAAKGDSNDIGADIELLDANNEASEYDWDEISSIRFASAPVDHPLFEPHLWGRVDSSLGRYSGTVAWDRDESYPSQILDWETKQNEDVETPFSDIVSLSRDGKGTLLTTKDGTEQWVDGSNDVNPENRGLMLHVPQIGLLEIPWSQFESVTFSEMPASELPGRDAWNGLSRIMGSLSSSEGATPSGPLVFDLRQSQAMELVEGTQDGIEISIPWRLIQTVKSVPDQPKRIDLQLAQRRFELEGASQLPGRFLSWLHGDPLQRMSWTDFVSANIEVGHNPSSARSEQP